MATESEVWEWMRRQGSPDSYYHIWASTLWAALRNWSPWEAVYCWRRFNEQERARFRKEWSALKDSAEKLREWLATQQIAFTEVGGRVGAGLVSGIQSGMTVKEAVAKLKGSA